MADQRRKVKEWKKGNRTGLGGQIQTYSSFEKDLDVHLKTQAEPLKTSASMSDMSLKSDARAETAFQRCVMNLHHSDGKDAVQQEGQANMEQQATSIKCC